MVPEISTQTETFEGEVNRDAGIGDKILTPRTYVPASSTTLNNNNPRPSSSSNSNSSIRPKDLQIFYEYNLRNQYPTSYSYQDVNADKQLQYSITDYFLEKTIDWMKHDKSYKKVKKFLRYLTGPDGEEIMHKILRLFVKKGETNWYDLKIQKSLVKNYIKHRLAKL
jgi:hypothetical protein